MPARKADERRPVWVSACHKLQHPHQPHLQRVLGMSGENARRQELSQVLTLQDLQNQMQPQGVSGSMNTRTIREGIARWVCGDDSNWVPCWSCQEKVCDVCKIIKLLTPPPTQHGCYPRCEVCFSLHVQMNAALPTCFCLPSSRPMMEFTNLEDTPREICKDCAKLPDHTLLEMRKQWEISQGYDYPDWIWCCDCGMGQKQGQMFWSCDRCSGQCFDMIHNMSWQLV